MNDILLQLRSPRWWFGVVFAGLFLNILAAYLKPAVDGAFGWMRGAFLRRSEKGRREYAERVQRLAGDPHRQILVSLHAVRLRQSALTSLILGMSFIGLSLTLAGRPFGIFCMVMAFEELFTSLRALYRASEADRSVYDAAVSAFLEVRGAPILPMNSRGDW